MMDIKEQLILMLEQDDRYKQVLSGVQEPEIKAQIDATVRQFLDQMSEGLGEFQRVMADPEAKKKFEELLKRG